MIFWRAALSLFCLGRQWQQSGYTGRSAHKQQPVGCNVIVELPCPCQLQTARRQLPVLPEKRPQIGRERPVRQHSSKGPANSKSSEASLSRSTSYQRVPSSELLTGAAVPSLQTPDPVVVVDPGGPRST